MAVGKVYYDYTSYGITPEQYHAGVDKLWAALGLTGVQDKDVFTLAAERIKELEAKLELTKITPKNTELLKLADKFPMPGYDYYD